MVPADEQTWLGFSAKRSRQWQRTVMSNTSAKIALAFVVLLAAPPHLRGWLVKREWEMCPSVGLRPGPQTPVE
jgi:hypothetical protein